MLTSRTNKENKPNQEKLTQQTIDDFGRQWTSCRENEGYYGSVDHFSKLVSPVLGIHEIENATIAEIGVGTGRISHSLMLLGATHLYAIEPSKAIEVAKTNLSMWGDKISFINKRGGSVGNLASLDFVFSIGVIHHIVDPIPVLQAAKKSLKTGGSLVIWVYGKEGNSIYLFALKPIRTLMQLAPNKCSWAFAWTIFPFAKMYGKLALMLKIPLWRYFRSIYNNLSNIQQALVIHDQITPSVARYYTRDNIQTLLIKSGFKKISIRAVEGYSWIAKATK
ncbi:MAG TPA: class I SAM-dependent methyltransferase [Phycisphaerales bacterium]|nr:class I SAM-dependent methyltransferase [Phycisphaerales bacterium]